MIRLLAHRELKSGRRMSILLILSVILTCVMFTCIANIGGNIYLGNQIQTMRMVGGNRMAGLKYALPEDYDRALRDPKTKDVVYRIIVGSAINEELQNIRVEVDCAGDEEAANACFCLPTTGRLPERMEEIAVSTLVLEELRLPKELGITIPMTIDVDGEILEREFTLCGFWKGDGINMAQLAWVSKAFADKYVPTPEVNFHRQEEGMKYGGYLQVDFNFQNSFDIEGKMTAFLDRTYGAELRPDFGVNWAYAFHSESIDVSTVVGLATLVLLIFLAGYLIIYNIFRLNVAANIHKYGLLKTIGMTPKQVGQVVRIQAGVYAVIGIPIGLLIGTILGKILYLYIRPSLNLAGNDFKGVGPKDMLAFGLIAAVFSFLTVLLSANTPAHLAGKASPMEALRYNETKLPTKKTEKKSRKVSTFSIARSNMARSRIKTVIVVLSLTLSLVILNVLATGLRGLDMDKMLQHLMVGDFEILSHQPSGFGGDSRIRQEDVALIQQLDGIKECNLVYCDDNVDICLSKEGLERAQKLLDEYGNAEKYESLLKSENISYTKELDVYISLRNLAKGTPYFDAGRIRGDLYAVSPGLLAHMQVIEGTLDAERFATGNYVLVYTSCIGLEAEHGEDQLCKAGEKITIKKGDIEKEYEVMAVCDIPYALSTKKYTSVYCHLILPEGEFCEFTDQTNVFNISITAEEGKLESLERGLEALTTQTGDGFALKTKQGYLEEFRGLRQMFTVVGGALTIILAVIGILNFVNTVVTGMISRKKEFVVMQAVGMTGRQMKEMLIFEGLAYAVWTILCSAVAGVGLAYWIVNGLAKESGFFSYHFTAVPILFYVPFLLALAVLVPVISFRWISRGNQVNVTSLE